jgi:hypothetical protein
MRSYRPSRRAVFRGALAVGGIGISGAKVAAQELPVTPQCGAEGTATPRQTEGPFFRAGSPGRDNLVEPGSKARQVELVGFVLTRGCNPVARAVVDMWHADERGNRRDGLFRKELLMGVDKAAAKDSAKDSVMAARFDFVIDLPT